ncbi:MAG: 4-oxalocrotonate decarboxylase [Jatrophihabitans sp.]|nr:MAG: 4-oxalocrotonate decarboxylase [Jatrophihabitans sp.]
MSLAQAYAVQHELIALRVARGERVVGTKLGFTSKAKMAQMGVSEIIVGQLTDATRIEAGGVALARFIHPRIEPEVAFRLARDVDPDDPDADVATAVDAIAPALEIIDSRYRDFRFDLPSVVADNTSAAAFVVGDWVGLDGDVRTMADYDVELLVDGTVAERGSTADILGHPAAALHELTVMAARYGFSLTAGQVILAGAATAAAPFAAGRAEARVHGLGSVTVRGI